MREFHQARDGFLKELSERRLTEQALRKERDWAQGVFAARDDAMNYVQTVISTSPVGLETFKATGEAVSVNAAAARILGASTEQLLRQNFREIPSWRKFGLLEMADLALASGHEQRGDFSVETTFGKSVDIDCLFVPFRFGGEQHLLLVITDITERKRSESDLRHSVSLTNAVLESTPDGILVLDGAGKIVRRNQRLLEVWGIPADLWGADEDDGLLSFGRAQVKDEEASLARVRELNERPEESSSSLVELKDGRLLERYSQPLCIADEIIGRFWSFRDVTERTHAEDRRLDAMNYLQTVISTSPVGLVTFKATGEPVSVNAAAARILGALTEQLLSQNFREIGSWQKFGLLKVAERAMTSGQEQRGDFSVVTTFGKAVDIDCLFVPFQFGGEQHMLAVIADITTRTRFERDLRHSARRDSRRGSRREDRSSKPETTRLVGDPCGSV